MIFKLDLILTSKIQLFDFGEYSIPNIRLLLYLEHLKPLWWYFCCLDLAEQIYLTQTKPNFKNKLFGLKKVGLGRLRFLQVNLWDYKVSCCWWCCCCCCCCCCYCCRCYCCCCCTPSHFFNWISTFYGPCLISNFGNRNYTTLLIMSTAPFLEQTGILNPNTSTTWSSRPPYVWMSLGKVLAEYFSWNESFIIKIMK